MDGTGKCVAPSLVSQLPLVPGGIHRSILHDACGAHVGAILTFQDARPVRGRVDGRSDTLVFMILSVHSNGHRRDPQAAEGLSHGSLTQGPEEACVRP